MTVPLQQGDGQSFFQAQTTNPDSADLISTQLDPTKPQVEGLTAVSDPLLPDRQVIDRLGHFDPELFDLRDSSHLMRLLKVLLGAPGTGGLRKQASLRRLGAGSLSGTHFLDLDGFWGALYGVSRFSDEVLDGDPAARIADQDAWDEVTGRDGQYRSRLIQFARAVNQGATYHGLIAAAEALLGIEVDLLESWVLADQMPPGAPIAAIGGNSYFAVRSTYGSYGNMRGKTWGRLVGGQQMPGQTPLGNRGEIVIRPRRTISQEEKRYVSQVLDTLKPAGTLVTVLETSGDSQVSVQARGVWADSEHWDVVSLVTPRSDLVLVQDDIYPGGGEYENGRPAFSGYSGESWSYNSRFSSIAAYRMVEDEITAHSNHQTVTYLDGNTHDYTAADGVMSAHQTAAARAASEGILTIYPFPEVTR